MAENANTRPWYFNLKADGDTAIVRLLHSDTSTIESVKSHRVVVGDKKRRIKCLETDCPLCNSGNAAEDRIYVHLFDYTDNKEKVWERTDKIIPQLVTLQNSWNPLCTAVIKITRKGNEFPKYEIEVQNPNNFSLTPSDLIDKPVAKMYSMSRKAEEVQAFLDTGAFPERQAYVSKEEYAKMKAEERAAFNSESTEATSPAGSVSQVNDAPFDDPFLDGTPTTPRKV